MRKTDKNLMMCGMVFAVALVVSNMIAAKTFQTGITLFGVQVIVPCAVVCYCVTFLITDVVGEIWGKEEATHIVRCGLFCQIIACALIFVGQLLPASDAQMQISYEMIFGQNAVFVIASLVGYLASQSWDVFIFHKIRDFFLVRGKSPAWRWVWNNASTMTSQAIDTLIFIGVAFGFGMGWLFDSQMLPVLGAMMIGQYACKLLLAALDTPVFYFLTRRASSTEARSASV